MGPGPFPARFRCPHHIQASLHTSSARNPKTEKPGKTGPAARPARQICTNAMHSSANFLRSPQCRLE
jgi:hypothetical protein